MSPEGPKAPEPQQHREIFPMSRGFVTSRIGAIATNPNPVLEHDSVSIGTQQRGLMDMILPMTDALNQRPGMGDAFFEGAVLSFSLIRHSAENAGVELPAVTPAGFRALQAEQRQDMTDAKITDPVAFANRQQEKIEETDPEVGLYMDQVAAVLGGLDERKREAARYGAVTAYLSLRSALSEQQLQRDLEGES